MPKINFNVNLIDENGVPATRPKFDKTKVRPSANGQMVARQEVDEEGYLVMEQIKVKDLLVEVLGGFYQGDETTPFPDRAKRARLMRKVARAQMETSYSVDELKMIQDYAAKAGSVALIAQLDELMGESEAQNEAA